MRGVQGVADDTRVQARDLLVVLFGALVVVALIGGATQASARRACVSASYDDGYSYAGHQAAFRGHGVRATITATRAPGVEVGHVAGWVGVGGPGQGANGSDEWIQAGIAAMPGRRPFLYTEITRPGGETRYFWSSRQPFFAGIDRASPCFGDVDQSRTVLVQASLRTRSR